MVTDRHTLLPPELQLVFLSGAGAWALEPMRELLHGGLRWPLVLQFARREGATRVLLDRLRDINEPELLPDDPIDALRSVTAIQEFRMAILQERLVKLLNALDSLGHPVVLLKGAAVALGAFGKLEDRPMGDLDLLVSLEDADRIHELALSSGWQRPGRGLHPEMYRDLHHLLPLDAADGLGFGLEIHTDLFPNWSPFAFSARDMWRDAQPLKRPGFPTNTLVPSPEHQLLHTCLHFAWSHCFSRGAWRMVRDMEVLLATPGLDLPALAGLAASARGESCVYWTLSVLRALTGGTIGGELAAMIPAPVPRYQREPLLRHLTYESLGNAEIMGTRRLRRALWSLAIRPRRSGHNGRRPWDGADRWPGMEDPFDAEREPGRVPAKFRGMLTYAGRILAGKGRLEESLPQG